jgi:putative ABC transport system substrate-binding protein
MLACDGASSSPSWAAAWPLAARAQSGVKSHRVSFLALVPREDETLMKALLERLHELGYSEGTNLIFEYRSAEGRPDRLGQLAMELVQAKPDVLVAVFGTLAAKAATTTIPVAFTTVGDPLGAGIIANLARPGGNVTGLTDQARDVQGKRLQLLLELLPGKNETRAQPSDFGTGSSAGICGVRTRERHSSLWRG